MVKTSLSHIFSSGVYVPGSCRKFLNYTETFFLAKNLSNGANAKSCVFGKKNSWIGLNEDD